MWFSLSLVDAYFKYKIGKHCLYLVPKVKMTLDKEDCLCAFQGKKRCSELTEKYKASN